jgi:hypothetical protein
MGDSFRASLVRRTLLGSLAVSTELANRAVSSMCLAGWCDWSWALGASGFLSSCCVICSSEAFGCNSDRDNRLRLAASPLIVRMHPKIRRDLARFRRLDHDRRRVSSFLARPAFQRRLKFSRSAYSRGRRMSSSGTLARVSQRWHMTSTTLRHIVSDGCAGPPKPFCSDQSRHSAASTSRAPFRGFFAGMIRVNPATSYPVAENPLSWAHVVEVTQAPAGTQGPPAEASKFSAKNHERGTFPKIGWLEMPVCRL